MIRIAISPAAFDAVAATLPVGSMAVEAEANERGERYVWLEERWLNKLDAMRRRTRPIATSFSDWSGWRARGRHSLAGRRRRARLQQRCYLLLLPRPARSYQAPKLPECHEATCERCRLREIVETANDDVHTSSELHQKQRPGRRVVSNLTCSSHSTKYGD